MAAHGGAQRSPKRSAAAPPAGVEVTVGTMLRNLHVSGPETLSGAMRSLREYHRTVRTVVVKQAIFHVHLAKRIAQYTGDTSVRARGLRTAGGAVGWPVATQMQQKHCFELPPPVLVRCPAC